MAALVELVVVDEFGIRPLGPAPRGWIEFVREDAHGNRNGDPFDAFDAEERRELVLPIETGGRKRRVRQPGDCDVVEDVVARKALRKSTLPSIVKIYRILAVPKGTSSAFTDDVEMAAHI